MLKVKSGADPGAKRIEPQPRVYGVVSGFCVCFICLQAVTHPSITGPGIEQLRWSRPKRLSLYIKRKLPPWSTTEWRTMRLSCSLEFCSR